MVHADHVMYLDKKKVPKIIKKKKKNSYYFRKG